MNDQMKNCCILEFIYCRKHKISLDSTFLILHQNTNLVLVWSSKHYTLKRKKVIGLGQELDQETNKFAGFLVCWVSALYFILLFLTWKLAKCKKKHFGKNSFKYLNPILLFSELCVHKFSLTLGGMMLSKLYIAMLIYNLSLMFTTIVIHWDWFFLYMAIMLQKLLKHKNVNILICRRDFQATILIIQ